ncbi:MAG: acetate kinase, partial [Afipia sp.]|nr:acetate kinase [Afipia sp.]
MGKAILTINAGSSSLKFSIYRIDDQSELSLNFEGVVSPLDKIPVLKIKDASGSQVSDQTWDRCPEFSEILSAVMERSEALLGTDTLFAVGHRVVHGGP